VRPPARVPRVRDYLQLLCNGWLVILCATALSVGAGWVAWETATPVYQSTARVFATTPGGATTTDALYGDLSAVSRTLTIQRLARSSQVTVRTIDELGLAETPSDLANDITVVVTKSALMDVVVAGHDADLTRRTADVVVANMIALNREMSRVDTAAGDLVLVDHAGPAVRQGSMWRFMLFGGVLGIVISAISVLGYGLISNKLLGKGHVDHIVDEAVAERDR
jgi:capsular polysaccharide biosynthesis protein